ncbi:MAG: hypothetical protein KTR31_36490 [Myxococcales bacterium]|nr:hypothetical protein [Myxococcales bacterium]
MARLSPTIRFITLFAGLITLMVLWDTATVGGQVGYLRLAQAPEGWTGTIPLAEVIELQPPGGYVLRKSSVRIEVSGASTGLEIGQEWSVHGTFRAGRLVEAWRVAARARPAKKRLGLLGLGLTAALVGLAVRPTRAGLVLRG